MRKITIVTVAAMVAVTSLGSILPAREERIILGVARKYELCEHRTKLLMAIRRIENGANGLEFGVGDGIPSHPARRHAGNFTASLRLQAEWAAGTIAKRYNGDLRRFSRRYCRANWRVWLRNVRHYLKEQADVVYAVADTRMVEGYEDADTINRR